MTMKKLLLASALVMGWSGSGWADVNLSVTVDPIAIIHSSDATPGATTIDVDVCEDLVASELNGFFVVNFSGNVATAKFNVNYDGTLGTISYELHQDTANGALIPTGGTAQGTDIVMGVSDAVNKTIHLVVPSLPTSTACAIAQGTLTDTITLTAVAA